MTDNLRTRIAAITASLIREEIDIDPVWLVAQHVADAVIRELQLTVLGDGIVVGVLGYTDQRWDELSEGL